MRNLILFFIRYNAFFLFLLLEIICFYLIVQNNKVQGERFFSSANTFYGSLYKGYSRVVDYWNLPAENARLAAKNAYLLSKTEMAFENHFIDSTMVFDSIYQQRYHYTAATVINNSVSEYNNYLTLDRGSKHGIRENTGVITNDGLVGIVLKTSYNYSAVMSLLHHNTRITAELKKNSYRGSLVWREGLATNMTLEAIPKHAPIAIGDTIVTSGFSSLFPQGVNIGFIEKFWREPGSNFYTIDVRLSGDLNKVKYVYVVDDFMKEEQQELEKEVKDE